MRIAYRERLETIAHRLPAALLALARGVNLHDAIIESVRWAPHERRLRLSLVSDSEIGCSLLELGYEGARLGEQRVDALRRAALSRETELLYDEVDLDEDGMPCHRLLFWPNEELTIDFEAFAMTVHPRPDRRVNLLGAFVVEPPDSADD